MLDKYVGRMVQIIYVDRYNRITQRLIEVKAAKDDLVKAYCLKQKALRVFKTANILAIAPISNKRSG